MLVVEALLQTEVQTASESVARKNLGTEEEREDEVLVFPAE